MDATRRTRANIRFKKAHDFEVKPRQDPKLPGAKTMARGVIRSAMELAQKGPMPASKEEQDQRMATCRKCEHFRKTDNRCSKCGCFMAWKSRMRAWSCPVNKW